MRDLLGTQMQNSPQEMVYVLWVLDQITVEGQCNLYGVGANLFADHLERLWLNEILGEDIPKAKTVSEAIALENDLQRANNLHDHALRKTRQRAFTKSFSAEIRLPSDPIPKTIIDHPTSYTVRSTNVWLSQRQSPNPIVVAIAFKNISPRAYRWPPTSLLLKNHATERYVSFFCKAPYGEGDYVDEREKIQPGQRFVAECEISQSDWPSDDIGFALLTGLANKDDWVLRSEASNEWTDGPQRYRQIRRVLTVPGSRDKAEKVVASSNCIERESCKQEFILPIMNSMFVKLLPAWLSGLTAGALATILLRPFAKARPVVVPIALTSLLMIAAGLNLAALFMTPGLGMIAVVLFFFVIAACVGGLIGIWAAFIWLAIIRAREKNLSV